MKEVTADAIPVARPACVSTANPAAQADPAQPIARTRNTFFVAFIRGNPFAPELRGTDKGSDVIDVIDGLRLGRVGVNRGDEIEQETVPVRRWEPGIGRIEPTSVRQSVTRKGPVRGGNQDVRGWIGNHLIPGDGLDQDLPVRWERRAIHQT